MDLGFNLNTSQKLEQTLSPQLRQFVTILQKTSIELDSAIKDELESNPLLELDDSIPDEERPLEDRELPETDSEIAENKPDDFDAPDYSSLEDSADIDRGILDGENAENFDYDRYLQDGTQDDDAPFRDLNTANKEDEKWDNPIKDVGKSLQENLRDQLLLWSGTQVLLEQLKELGCSEKRFRSLVEYLIDSLDENGFLSESSNSLPIQNLILQQDEYVAEIEKMIRGDLLLEDASLPVKEAVHVLQGFSPKGIGARNQRECFLIQAYAIPNFSPLAIKMLEDFYDELLTLKYSKIAKSLKVSTEEVQQAVLSFAKLSPHPGFQLSNSRTHTISPDLKIISKHGKMEVEAVRSNTQKRLRINQTYKSILDDKKASAADKEYVRNHVFKAEQFINAVDNRYSTLELVMGEIFKRQKDFFVKGPAFLKPMIQQDIADSINRDVSTVNRSVNGKYVETPYGIYELKQFFTTAIKQNHVEGGEDLSSAVVLDAIKKLVDEEDKKKPLSDQAIADKLLEQGIKVARRTVAKYREKELRILPASQRKR